MKLMDKQHIPFLCSITPIFDGCIESYKLLVESLKQQSFSDFNNIAISNGGSPTIKDYVMSLEDMRFIYLELPYQEITNAEELIIDLGRRRNYCLQNFNADRFVFLDADLKISNIDYFAILKEKHYLSEILLTKIKTGKNYLPRYPFSLGKVDIANYSFTNRIAKKYPYPTDFNPYFRCANDYRYFSSIKYSGILLLDCISAEKDGNKTYKRVSEIVGDM